VLDAPGGPRLRLFEGDVLEPIARGGWDGLLMDVDQGSDAVTTRSNAALYGRGGVARMAQALAPGGVPIVWSAYGSDAFEHALRQTGLTVEARRVHARTKERKGSRHTLFIGRAGRR
jgi:hypothetical protein